MSMNVPDEMPMDNEQERQIDDAVARMLRARRDNLRASVPLDVERRIRLSLAEETAPKPLTPTENVFSSIIAWFKRPIIAIPAALVVLAFVTLAVSRNSDDPLPVDLHRVAYANFSSVVKGDLSLVKTTSDTSALRAFFAGSGVDYPVFFPSMKAELKGGVVSMDNGHAYAHLVYGIGDHIVYLFEADQASIDGQIASLDTVITNDLNTGKWHWEERPGTGTLFVWKSNNVVCLAVSDLRTQDMSALFTLEAL